MTEKESEYSPSKWVVAGIYVTLLFESATLGLLCQAAFREIMQNSATKMQDRDSNTVIILTLVCLAVVGYLTTLPCLCYAAQKHSPSGLVPYLVWRMLFSLIIIVIVIWQALIKRSKPMPFSSSFFGKQFPMALGEIILGTVFFCLSMRAYRDFEIKRMGRRRSEDDQYTEDI